MKGLKQYCAFRWLLPGLAAAYFASTAQALDPNREISQYIRDQWGAQQGFPGGTVYAIAATDDGFLWIGAAEGLVRFDGLSFRLFNHANLTALPAGPILGLITDADGYLWIRPQSSGLVRYRAGLFRDFSPDLPRAETGVTAMCLGVNGELLLARPSGNLKYSGGRLVPLELTAERLVISMAQTADGKIWMGTRDAGLFSPSEGGVSSVAEGLPDKKVNTLLAVGDRQLWIGTDSGLARWNGTELTQAGLSRSLEHAQILAMTRDHESNVWVGTARGLVRVNAKGVSSLEERGRQPSGAVTAVFEDREGDLWVGSAGGVERFRDSVFMTYSPSGGLRPDNNGPIYVDTENRTWFAPSDGGLFWMRGERIEQITTAGLSKDVVYSIAGGPGELWVGRQRGGLTHLITKGGSFTAETYTQAQGLAQNSIYAVHRNRDGTVWVGTLNGGASRFSDGRFTTYTTANGLASNTVGAIEESSDGAMWFATPNGLNALSKDRWRVYTGRDGLPPGNVNCLLEDSTGVLWIGSSEGVAFLTSGQIHVPRDVPESLHDPVFGAAQDKNGWLWIATSSHVLRVNREKLLHGAISDADVREYSLADGLRGTGGVKRNRSVVADSLGRVWFSLNRGLSVVDPTRLTGNSAPAPVHIQAISADGRPIDLREPVRIPPARQRFTFSYTGLSLSAPDRVKYRYMLDGFDRGWSEPTAAREAVYTNLGPGSYRFRVIASNPDGVWNRADTAIGFEIDPVIWQTWWFRFSGVLTCILAFAAVYRFRLHELTRQLNVRFEERLAERTRIAQELHDTLLQGFLSASMQLHVAVDRLPVDSPAKPPLSRVLELMRQVIDEGRNAVRGLRSSQSGSLDLEQAFSTIQHELGIQEEIAFRIIVDGEPRPLHPVLRDEVYRIGREALVNAFRHARATSVEVELEYPTNHFRILVRDNGHGIDPQVLQSGREGHFGLSGMRERAERIGARLRVWSRAEAGTEVELTVPGHIAFQFPSSNRMRKWLAKLYPRKAAALAPEPRTERER
jgi:signal transduction histidine kinase/ligand-binding sensor domain-containing protein